MCAHGVGCRLEMFFLRQFLCSRRRLCGNGRAVALLLCAAIGCGTVKDTDTQKRPVEYLSMNQCNRNMTGLDKRVGDMEALLNNGAPAVEVLEQVHQLRQDIPSVQAECSGNDA